VNRRHSWPIGRVTTIELVILATAGSANSQSPTASPTPAPAKRTLEVVIVISRAPEMKLVMDDVKSKMVQLSEAVHRLVPTARVGFVAYGGKRDAIEVLRPTNSLNKLRSGLEAIEPLNHDSGGPNFMGALETAVSKATWNRRAKKVIVFVADTAPVHTELLRAIELVKKFHAEGGTFNAVDVTAEIAENVVAAGGSPQPAERRAQVRSSLKTLAAEGGGALRSLKRDAEMNRTISKLLGLSAPNVTDFGDPASPTRPQDWLDEVRR